MTAPETVQPDVFGFAPAFAVDAPATHILPFVFNTGHSGAVYPSDFIAASRLDALSLRRSEDAYVDRLFASVVELGAPLLRANFPRAFLDVNREPFELDPRMFDGRLPPFANTRSMRVAGGLGTVPASWPMVRRSMHGGCRSARRPPGSRPCTSLTTGSSAA